jgi:protoporphyrinogen oxidase
VTRRVLVVGAGLEGLACAWRRLQSEPGLDLRIVERSPEPGGQARTLRIEGYRCELGPQLLRRGPRLSELTTALGLETIAPRIPLAWSGDEPQILPYLVRGLGGEPGPQVTFRTGVEELVQALRRRLQDRLWLGRRARSLSLAEGSALLHLEGEPEQSCAADEVWLCVPPADAALLLQEPDPEQAARLRAVDSRRLTNVWLGFRESEVEGLAGAGSLLAGDDPLLAVLHCSRIADRQTLSGNFLVRLVLEHSRVPAGADLDATAQLAESWFRARTGCAAQVLFRRVRHVVWPIPGPACTPSPCFPGGNTIG